MVRLQDPQKTQSCPPGTLDFVSTCVSENNWLPALHSPSYLHELALPQQVVMAHPANESAYIDTTKESLLLIGPEGGFSDDEVSSLLNKQVKPMSLGPTLLRAEAAAIVGLTLLGHQYGHY